jgi:hypothetical protein
MVHEIHRTGRLRLREYTRADEAQLFGVFADPMLESFALKMADRVNVIWDKPAAAGNRSSAFAAANALALCCCVKM